ncbi:myosin regulatory light chain 2, ventricular/cardiac muscle isoform [Dermatophagoides farinae]|uniref:Myosin regulatory light chain n=1 Tax=Dermatophagoides farinae TaxID=6954 RepID=A0A922HLD7_DERFA|nr:myosin regulatory light chain 2-like [Dermatophagoides farinae]KAH7640007.1 myosin regulatory light chain 2-like [Dermatophagoides farinae]KAH9493342.1 Myosin regulatory light chain [Dermatophagoides farinae]
MADETKEKKKKSKKSEKAAAPAAEPAAAPAAAEESAAPKTSSKKRAQRSGSNVFAMFTQHQVAEFKEAFQFIDQDKDGFLSKNDIRATFDSLGRICTDSELEGMIKEASGPINFTMFLTIFGDRTQGTDEEDVILNAFAQFDEGDGLCKEETLRHSLVTWGEKFSASEADNILAEAPTDGRGNVDIKKFAQILTRGEEEEGA